MQTLSGYAALCEKQTLGRRAMSALGAALAANQPKTEIEDLQAAGLGRAGGIRSDEAHLVLQLQFSDGSRFGAADGSDTTRSTVS